MSDAPPNPTVHPGLMETRFVRSASALRARSPFDVIVVGAGSAGCALAGALAEMRPDLKLLLVEAGGEAQNTPAVANPQEMTTTWNSHIDWGYVSDDLVGLRAPDGGPKVR